MTPEIAARENAAARKTWGSWGWKDNTKAQENGRKNGNKSKMHKAIIGTMRRNVKPMLIPVIAEKTGIARETVRDAIYTLQERGIVEKTGRKGARGALYWRVT